MFTGIVQGIGEVQSATPDGARMRLVVRLPERAQAPLTTGASVAIHGVCLTFVGEDSADSRRAEVASFDVIDETLRLTTLGALRPGHAVNVERAARFGDEIGGHLLSGHISGGATVLDCITTDSSFELRLKLDPMLVPYVLPKGFIGLDGCSLTVGPIVTSEGCFSVFLIPETLRRTTLSSRTAGDRVNVEIDAMTQAVVDTVRRVLG